LLENLLDIEQLLSQGVVTGLWWMLAQLFSAMCAWANRHGRRHSVSVTLEEEQALLIESIEVANGMAEGSLDLLGHTDNRPGSNNPFHQKIGGGTVCEAYAENPIGDREKA